MQTNTRSARNVSKNGRSSSRWKVRNAETRLAVSTLQEVFPKAEIDAYRYCVGSIRVRVIDNRFRGKGPYERVELVSDAIERLPEKIQSQILVVVPITPAEHRNRVYPKDYDFDHPLPPEPVYLH